MLEVGIHVKINLVNNPATHQLCVNAAPTARVPIPNSFLVLPCMKGHHAAEAGTLTAGKVGERLMNAMQCNVNISTLTEKEKES